MSSNVPPMSRPVMGGMGGSYAGANDMANNGLSANQNQVSINDVINIIIFQKVLMNLTVSVNLRTWPLIIYFKTFQPVQKDP